MPLTCLNILNISPLLGVRVKTKILSKAFELDDHVPSSDTGLQWGMKGYVNYTGQRASAETVLDSLEHMSFYTKPLNLFVPSSPFSFMSHLVCSCFLPSATLTLSKFKILCHFSCKSTVSSAWIILASSALPSLCIVNYFSQVKPFSNIMCQLMIISSANFTLPASFSSLLHSALTEPDTSLKIYLTIL